MNDENTIDLDQTETVTVDDIDFKGAWAELEEADERGLILLVEKLLGGETNVTLTSAKLKDSMAYAFMAGVVLAEAGMMSQLMAVVGMEGMMATMMEAELDVDDDEIGGDGEGGKSPDISVH